MAPTQLAPANPPTCSHSDLADFLNKLAREAHAESQPRLRQAAQHFQQLAEAPPVRPATPDQKMEIQRLATHPLLSRARKTLVLVAYVRYDYDEAAACIRELLSETSALDDMRAAA